MPTEQATRYTCPECGANLPVEGDPKVTTCSYCGTSVRLQPRTKVMQRPIKLPPPSAEEPARVARAKREWTAETIAAHVFLGLTVLGSLALPAWIFYEDWRRDHTVQWGDIHTPRLLDCDGDGVDDLVGKAALQYSPQVAAISGKTGRLLWHVPLGSHDKDLHFVVVAGGMVVAIDARGTMYGLDRTGAQRWKTDLPDTPRELCREPADETVLVVLPDNTLRKLTAKTGAVEPFAKPPGFQCVSVRGTSADYMPSGGEVEDHTSIAIPTIGIPTVIVRGSGLRIVAGEHEGGGRQIPRLAGVRPDNTVAWEHDISPGDPRDVQTGPASSLAISDDAVAVLYHRAGPHAPMHLAAFDRATGVARFDVEVGIVGKLAMTQDYVAVGNNACLDAYDTKTGKRRWKYGCDN